MISGPGHETLRERLDSEGPLPAEELKSGLLSLLPKLALLHSAGHPIAGTQARLLSPETIQIDSEGRWSLLRSDAAVLSEGPQFPQLQLAYLSPEQRDRGELTPAADIYAIGVLIFEVLVGGPPEGLEGLRERDPSLPLWAERAFKACYAPLSRRPKDADALLVVFQDAIAGPQAVAGMVFGTAIDPSLDASRLQLSAASEAVKFAPSMREPDFTVSEPVAPQSSGRSRMALALSFVVATFTSISMMAFVPKDGHLHARVPDNSLRLIEAQRLYKSGEYEGALKFCQGYFRSEPNPVAEAFHLRAQILFELCAMNEALDDFNRALIADPTRTDWYRDRADLLVYLRDPGNAIADYQRFLERCPDSPDAGLLRGRCAELASREPL